jgi:hypothetical protein
MWPKNAKNLRTRCLELIAKSPKSSKKWVQYYITTLLTPLTFKNASIMFPHDWKHCAALMIERTMLVGTALMIERRLVCSSHDREDTAGEHSSHDREETGVQLS